MTQTTLSATIGPTETCIPIEDGSSITDGGIIEIDAEVLLVTSVIGSNKWNVKRAMFGSVAAQHTASATVNIVLGSGGGGGGGGTVDSVVAGSGIAVDATDPANPVVSATGGGGGSQTPWTSDIDADGFSLNNVETITSNDGNPAFTGPFNFYGNTPGNYGQLGSIATGCDDAGIAGMIAAVDNECGLIFGGCGTAAESAWAGHVLILAFNAPGASTDPDIAIVTGHTSTERMRIKTGGNILIGTATDAATGLLQVNGNIDAQSFSVNGSPGDSVSGTLSTFTIVDGIVIAAT
jgi:hypothetical protein